MTFSLPFNLYLNLLNSQRKEHFVPINRVVIVLLKMTPTFSYSCTIKPLILLLLLLFTFTLLLLSIDSSHFFTFCRSFLLVSFILQKKYPFLFEWVLWKGLCNITFISWIIKKTTRKSKLQG